MKHLIEHGILGRVGLIKIKNLFNYLYYTFSFVKIFILFRILVASKDFVPGDIILCLPPIAAGIIGYYTNSSRYLRIFHQ